MKKIGSALVNILIALAWADFAYLTLRYFFWTHDPIYLLLTLSQTEFALLVLIRKKAFSYSRDPLDYLIAFTGTFVVFLYRPEAHLPSYFIEPYRLLGVLLVYFGALFELFGFLSLNTSAGIAPANRGIKTGGLYGIIRHPVYLGSMLLYAGYMILSPSPANLAVLLWAALFQLIRIQREEKVLMRDEQYQKYSKEVRWKLLPGIY